jgi:hypothetical protein
VRAFPGAGRASKSTGRRRRTAAVPEPQLQPARRVNGGSRAGPGGGSRAAAEGGSRRSRGRLLCAGESVRDRRVTGPEGPRTPVQCTSGVSPPGRPGPGRARHSARQPSESEAGQAHSSCTPAHCRPRQPRHRARVSPISSARSSQRGLSAPPRTLVDVLSSESESHVSLSREEIAFGKEIRRGVTCSGSRCPSNASCDHSHETTAPQLSQRLTHTADSRDFEDSKTEQLFCTLSPHVHCAAVYVEYGTEVCPDIQRGRYILVEAICNTHPSSHE